MPEIWLTIAVLWLFLGVGAFLGVWLHMLSTKPPFSDQRNARIAALMLLLLGPFLLVLLPAGWVIWIFKRRAQASNAPESK